MQWRRALKHLLMPDWLAMRPFPAPVLEREWAARNRDGVVRKVLHAVRPWRLGPLVWRSRCVLELPSGAAARTVAGDQLILLPLPDTDATSR